MERSKRMIGPQQNTIPEMIALIVLTGLYLVAGTWLFRRRHMRAR